ncbi:hypothetical protein P8C59_006950 [Phyllachora maydis]|uniref:Uncharacterized protein n=1 Tax=Phyllachora maydis TaxID=1825666 RepID=A0AAD9I7I1_9PEZI|nr:hypothetical protein P8C59_006950 [Phyllachora maydis]
MASKQRPQWLVNSGDGRSEISGSLEQGDTTHTHTQTYRYSWSRFQGWLQAHFDYHPQQHLVWYEPDTRPIYGYGDLVQVLGERLGQRWRHMIPELRFTIEHSATPLETDERDGRTIGTMAAFSTEISRMARQPDVSDAAVHFTIAVLGRLSSMEHVRAASEALWAILIDMQPPSQPQKDKDKGKAKEAGMAASPDKGSNGTPMKKRQMTRPASKNSLLTPTKKCSTPSLPRGGSNLGLAARGTAASRSRETTTTPSRGRSTAPVRPVGSWGSPKRSNAIEGKIGQPSTSALAQAPEAASQVPVGPGTAPLPKKVDIRDTLGLKHDVEDEINENYESGGAKFVDASLGSYRTGDTRDEWIECLNFFCVDSADYLQRTEGPGRTTLASPARKRAGMRRIHGMTVSLFDFQLMGVWKLLKLVVSGCNGGFLADACGVGKTVEMLGVLATGHTLRKTLAEVEQARKDGDWSKHCKPDKKGQPTGKCPSESKHKLKCPCRSGLAADMASRLPLGLNLLLCPASSCDQLFQQAKAKLDPAVFKVRRMGLNGDESEELSTSDLAECQGSITPTAKCKEGDEDQVPCSYSGKAGQDRFVIVAPEDQLGVLDDKLSSHVKMFQKGFRSNYVRVKRPGLAPGIVFLDEFHEYAQVPEHSQISKVLPWLRERFQHSSARPLVYFVSGTPVEKGPGDLLQALQLLDCTGQWGDAKRKHPMRLATWRELDKLDGHYRTLCARQDGGETLAEGEVAQYRKDLHTILNRLMVRRSATDKFRGRPLTELGPMRVKMHNLSVPDPFRDLIQELADRAEAEVDKNVGAGMAPSVSALMSSELAGRLPYVRALRLASTFPAMAADLLADVRLASDSGLMRDLDDNGGKLVNTAYAYHVAKWTAASPKMAVIASTLQTMLDDDRPVEGEATRAKKLCIFTTSDVEAAIVYAWLQRTGDARVKPVWLHPGGHADRAGPADASLARRERADVFHRVVRPFRRLGRETPNVLVASMARAGTGLDFPQAKYCVVTGLGWRRADSTQAFARTHRVGQRQRTELHLLLARGNPVERRLHARQAGLPLDEATAWRVTGQTDGGADAEAEARLFQGSHAVVGRPGGPW